MTITRVSPSEAETIADLKTFDGSVMPVGHSCIVTNLNSVAARFRWVSGLALAGDDQLLVTPTTGAASGRWLRDDQFISLKLPYTATAATNTVLATIPTGLRFGVIKVGLEIGTQFTGADTGSIGLGSDIGLNDGGLGFIVGNTGSAVGSFRGAKGLDIEVPQYTMLIATNQLRHHVLAAGYTGGTGFWHVMGALFQT